MVEWPRVKPGTPVSSTIRVFVNDKIESDDFQVSYHTGSPLISCSQSTMPPISETALGDDERVLERCIGAIDLHMQGGDQPGDFANALLVTVKRKGTGAEAARISVPIQWTVVPDVEVMPSRLWLGARKQGESVSGKLLLSGSEPLRIESVECDLDDWDYNLEQATDSPRRSQLTLKMTMPDRSGPWRTQVRITVVGESRRAIHVPVSAIVEHAE